MSPTIWNHEKEMFCCSGYKFITTGRWYRWRAVSRNVTHGCSRTSDNYWMSPSLYSISHECKARKGEYFYAKKQSINKKQAARDDNK